MFYDHSNQERRYPITPTLKNGDYWCKTSTFCVHTLRNLPLYAFICFLRYPLYCVRILWRTPLRKLGRFCENLAALPNPFQNAGSIFENFCCFLVKFFFCHFTDNSGRFYNVFSCIFDILDHFLLIIFFEIFVLRHFEKLKNVRSLKSLLHEIASESRKF